MATSPIKAPEPQLQVQPRVPVPRLENGDQLTRDEFERRYDAMSDVKKAELIEGAVHMPSPVRFGRHSSPHFDLITWLGTYRAATPGVLGGDNGSIRLDLDNMPQPDAFFLVLPTHGGQDRISEDDYVEGAPELVADVAASSVSFDLHAKLHVYRRNGVREYLIWRVEDRALDWYVLREGRYDRLQLGPESLYKSEVFAGLWLDPGALASGNLPAALEAVRKGVASPEHAAFVARLVQASQPRS